jgi:pyruvate/2-oxoglutarate dehydrogenase complex dihydrolipoamide dehydrogenase (E3) component
MSTRLAVIEAGPGGYATALHAADMGMKVTLVDADPNPGGVCTFRGCIPSKALLHVAKVIEEAKNAEVFGMSFGHTIDRHREASRLERRRGHKADRRPWSARQVAQGRVHSRPRVDCGCENAQHGKHGKGEDK